MEVSRQESNVVLTVEKNGRNERPVFVRVFTVDTGSATGTALVHVYVLCMCVRIYMYIQ